MSSDLLQEFGTNIPAQHLKPDADPNSSPSPIGTLLSEEAADDFGDFEIADVDDGLRHVTSHSTYSHDAPEHNDRDEWGDFEHDTVAGNVLFDADSELDAVVKRRSAAQTKLEIQSALPKTIGPDWEPWGTDDDVSSRSFATLLAPIENIKDDRSKVQSSNLEIKAANGSPPSNVPPPSVLLSMAPELLRKVPQAIRDILSTDYEDLEEARLMAVRAQLVLLMAFARILAGRKHRWKRDKILSQSMKIGPAGKQGGMKLAGIDRSESRREDQEAIESVRLWKQHIGPLRATIALVNVSLPEESLVVPEVSEAMPIRTAKLVDGVITAPKACFLCGIKRDERVWKVDTVVQDSFGEWWTEHWGHVDCVGFWTFAQDRLRRR